MEEKSRLQGGRTFYMRFIDAFMTERELPTMTWEDVLKAEGGHGSAFFKTKEEAILHPETHPGRWFASGEKDFGLYNEYPYIYSLLFGALQISRQTYYHFGKNFASGAIVNDVGGSIFTAIHLLRSGAAEVIITNVGDSPQLEFAKWLAKRLNVESQIHVEAKPVRGMPTVMSEYLEHFQKPLFEFDVVATSSGGKIVATANSFCTPAYGHFSTLIIDGNTYSDRRSANKAFREGLKKRGFSLQEIKMFNKSYYVASL